jgi:hypothetical protein
VVQVDAGDDRAIRASKMFTASKRPPKPTSKITTSRFASAKKANKAKLVNSK